MSLRGNRETTLNVIRFWVELEGTVAMEEVLLANESKACLENKRDLAR